MADSEQITAVAPLQTMNENYAGVYGTVVRVGELGVGQVVTLEARM